MDGTRLGNNVELEKLAAGGLMHVEVVLKLWASRLAVCSHGRRLFLEALQSDTRLSLSSPVQRDTRTDPSC